MSTMLLDRPTTAVTTRPGTADDHDALWRISYPVLLSRETYEARTAYVPDFDDDALTCFAMPR